MISLLIRAFLFYCFFIFLRGFLKGIKEKKPPRKPRDENVVEAEFRRMD